MVQLHSHRSLEPEHHVLFLLGSSITVKPLSNLHKMKIEQMEFLIIRYIVSLKSYQNLLASVAFASLFLSEIRITLCHKENRYEGGNGNISAHACLIAWVSTSFFPLHVTSSATCRSIVKYCNFHSACPVKTRNA